jgi:cell shape-determining protein MreC
MKLLKDIALGIFLAISSVGVSSVAIAEDDGRTVYTPAAAIKLVTDQIEKAQQAITEDVDHKEIAALIRKAKRFSKEINANDEVDRKRQHANNSLKEARKYAKENDLPEAAKELDEAKIRFSNLSNLL